MVWGMLAILFLSAVLITGKFYQSKRRYRLNQLRFKAYQEMIQELDESVDMSSTKWTR